jgi:hypothetical protein
MRVIAGGVLEAIMFWYNKKEYKWRGKNDWNI